MTCVFPESVIPKPEDDIAPRLFSGETKKTFFPDFAARIAATTAPEVPPYTITSPSYVLFIFILGVVEQPMIASRVVDMSAILNITFFIRL